MDLLAVGRLGPPVGRVAAVENTLFAGIFAWPRKQGCGNRPYVARLGNGGGTGRRVARNWNEQAFV